MHAQPPRVTNLAESCLVSQDHLLEANVIDNWSSDGLERGIVDLYARRAAAVAAQRDEARQEALDRMVVTQPFGRPFTAQPSFPPDPEAVEPGGLAAIRRRLAGAAGTAPRGKLATS
jgi:hypothetical protein